MSEHIKARVLLVEDSPSLAAVYVQYLRNEGCEVVHAATGGEAMQALQQGLPDVMLLDLHLPDMDGMDILREVHGNELPIATLIITAHGSVDAAVEAMRYGAFDFLVKPFDAKRLTVTLRNALERHRLQAVVDTYQDTFDRRRFQGFIGASLAMQAVYGTIESAAPSKATVFITGESGTGKEVCAQAIHRISNRKDKPFIALNCAAIPRDLIESEIFGHVKGAFTGAVAAREGAATRADGGTLFLDELCEMDLDLQSKLLRFTQTGTFQKVGSSKEERVDVRFVCATNRDPWKEVQEGRFREDLYYRLHVVPIALPPLRERDQDSVLIARHLLEIYAGEEGKAFSSFSSEAEAAIAAYTWPGNVRELQNTVRTLTVLNTGETVSLEMLPDTVRGADLRPVPDSAGVATPTSTATEQAALAGRHSIRPMWLVEKETIEQAIEACDGNIPRAAGLLELSPSTIYRKRQAWAES